MKKIKVGLRPIINNINLPTVIKTAVVPGETNEKIFVATQVGEILKLGDRVAEVFLDIRNLVIKLGSSGGYDERGLIGLAFHPEFNYNGLFYLHYSVAGSEGPGALTKSFKPDPCEDESLNLKWENRQSNYDHIDTVEEWFFRPDGKSRKIRTLLNLRRPFFNHNGVNSLNFSPETGKLILTTGDGGSGFDPFNLSQNDIEIAGKIIEIDVDKNIFIDNPPIVTRFNELPLSIQETLTVIAKGVRNIVGISFQKLNNYYIKYVGNVGQDSVESIFSFINYKPIPVTQIIQSYLKNYELDYERFINLGWRGWEGIFPTIVANNCTNKSSSSEKIIAYYNEAMKVSKEFLQPLISYFHEDSGLNEINGTALTGITTYIGNEIPDLTGNIIFTDFSDKNFKLSVKGALAYTSSRTNCKLNDYGVIEVDYDFENQSAFYVSLGSNSNQTKLYLGVYASMKVNNFNKGTVFEIVP